MHHCVEGNHLTGMNGGVSNTNKTYFHQTVAGSRVNNTSLFLQLTVWFGDAYTTILTSIMQGQTKKMIQLLQEPVNTDQ
jgi:hypothetical protein